ncbi:hypothetical protein [Paenibacillus macquariensis]|uniref:Uncharacterized protein n=1 Tax=Paenibacillus macquariensis TaxID=948756 RepID=A0ABY1JMF3_9BACL|nr:hypothetical protein [Paenibacillus macquariensis]MEC0092319.1 hypothetical protein [Paenibacillus macquariensis]OAB37140.1 hypothetical protein PMSM_03420 [Paenibacillus macquariensis subsp. macquariensis]SIQ46264.1 hypothetical protein SAMN05421578_102100 [Paenibacillus macquariensis]
MKVNKIILNISLWLAILAILFIPGSVPTEGADRIEYGFPLRFFIQYQQNHYEVGNWWFLQGARIELFNYLVNVAIIYVVIFGLHYMNNIRKNRRGQQ